MQLSSLLSILLATTTLTLAVNLTAINEARPKCAVACAMEGPVKAGCGLLDMACICARLPNISALGAPCMVEAGCKLDEIMQAGLVILGECEKEYAQTYGGSTAGVYAQPNDTAKTGGAAAGGPYTAVYGTGWAVISATMFAVFALLL